MKNLLFLGIAVVLMVVPSVSGFSVSSVSVDPSGDLKNGTPVTVTCEIPRTGILLYDQLVITTDLDTPRWDSVVIVRDQETPLNPAFATGNMFAINGAVYNYPPGVQVKVRVALKGTVPYNRTTNQTLLKIRQLDAEGTGYAFPSGYSLPMPGLPPRTIQETKTIPATMAKSPVAEDTAPATMASVPVDPSPVRTVLVPKTTVSVPTAWPTGTPAAAWPAEPLLILGAIGITGYCMRQKPDG